MPIPIASRDTATPAAEAAALPGILSRILLNARHHVRVRVEGGPDARANTLPAVVDAANVFVASNCG
jgi:hypothetical protein